MTDRDDRQDISELLVRYATGIDRRDWPLFRTVFTDNCELDYGEVGSWQAWTPSPTSWTRHTRWPVTPCIA
jgi:hypothetical protein